MGKCRGTLCYQKYGVFKSANYGIIGEHQGSKYCKLDVLAMCGGEGVAQIGYHYMDYTHVARLANGDVIKCPICLAVGIHKAATHTFNEDKIPEYCFTHSKSVRVDMGDRNIKAKGVFSRTCDHCKEKQSRWFNWSNENGGKYCYDCSLIVPKPNIYGNDIVMENKATNKCIICNIITASFNWNNQIKSLWCLKCSTTVAKPIEYGSEIIMVNVHSKKCSCGKHQPVFNFPNEMYARYCNECKQIGMINIVDDRCYGILCDKKPLSERTRPNYGIKGQDGKWYCSPCAHTMFGSENVDNLTTPICEYIYENGIKCEIKACYGYLKQKHIKCAEHRDVNQIRFVNASCEYCDEKAVCGPNFTNKYCIQHPTWFSDYLGLQQCKKCNNQMIISSQDNLCELCNLDFRKTRILKYQESLMRILDEDEDLKSRVTSTDKRINGGKDGLERPDRVYDCSNYIIIVECDEDQHKGSTKEEELIRMRKIAQWYKPRPVYFIRWNPNKYYPSIGKQELYENRHYKLRDLLKIMVFSSGVIHTHRINIYYMYYDGFTKYDNMADIKWQCENPIIKDDELDINSLTINDSNEN